MNASGFVFQRDVKKLERKTALTIGNFDGIHLGHAALIGRLVSRARETGLEPALITFHPHPHAVFAPDKPHSQLYGFRQKLLHLRENGVERVAVLRFTEAFSRLSPERFMEMLRQQFGVALLVLGKDYRFGHKRRGDTDLLAHDARMHGYELDLVDDVVGDGGRVASRRVRELVRNGDFAGARRLLGRPYAIAGKVVRGDGIGSSRLGFPTINLGARFLPPCEGIFAAKASIEGFEGEIPAAMSIGRRPAVSGRSDKISVEAYLIDFSGDLYRRRAVLRPVSKIRDEQNYASMDELSAAIGEDVRAARKILGA